MNPAVVTPGQRLRVAVGFLRGHGSYLKEHDDDDEDDVPNEREGEAAIGARLTEDRQHANVDDDEEDEEEEEDDDRAMMVDVTDAIEEEDLTASLHASVLGTVHQVNKLVTVVPPRSRFAGSVGDVVVGRIVEVGNKRWKVDVNAKQDAVLLLGSVNLPGGAQRRRTMEDQLQMRQLFAERDVISCEVASIYRDGSLAVQTRSMRYGKLENGMLVTVPPALVRRQKHHFVRLKCGVDLVLGLNGYIWLSSASDESEPPVASTSVYSISHKSKKSGGSDFREEKDLETLGQDDDDEEEEEEEHATLDKSFEDIREVQEMERFRSRHASRVVTAEERSRVARVANCIRVLAEFSLVISPTSVAAAYEATLRHVPLSRPQDVLIPQIARLVVGGGV